jgi:hypothetical protein
MSLTFENNNLPNWTRYHLSLRRKGEKAPFASPLQLSAPYVCFTACNELHEDVLEGQEEMGPYHPTWIEHFPVIIWDHVCF